MREPTENQQASSALASHLRELRTEVAALDEAGAGPLTDVLAHWLAAHYAAAARSVAAEANGALDFKTLRALTVDVVALRQGDHSAIRLQHEKEWLAIERERRKPARKDQIETALDALAEEVETRPEAKAALDALVKAVHPAHRQPLTMEERADRIREVFGLAPKPKRGLSPETVAEIDRALNPP